MRMVSTSVMIQQLESLTETNDLNDWEKQFVRNLANRLEAGEVTRLTDNQVEKLDELYRKHFA